VNIATTLGGGNYGHVGIIMEPTENSTMSGGITLADSLNPDFYPATLAATAAAGSRAKAEAEHKELMNQYKTFQGVCLGTKDLILEAVDYKYLIKIENETLRFLNKTPKQMLEHLLDRGGALNFANTKNLIAKRDREWNINKNPQIYFNRVEKAMKSLAQNGINSDLNKRRDMTLYHLKATGGLDALFANGNRNLQLEKRVQALKPSSQWNMQERTSKTNSRRSKSQQMQSKSRLKQWRN
jgi:hypothetical protein